MPVTGNVSLREKVILDNTYIYIVHSAEPQSE